MVDLLFDGALLRAELALADEIGRRWGSSQLAEIIRRWVELQCLLVIARARRQSDGLPVVRQYFGLPIGEADWLAALYEAEEPEGAQVQLAWRTALESVLDGELVSSGQVAVSPEEPVGAQEVERVARRADEVLIERVRAVRWVPFGPEPVFGYLWGLRAETDNLKAIVGGLQAGVSPEVIREQLRPTYV